MASFDKAYKFMAPSEGLYSNDLRDPGGETYKGISRRYQSDWNGWVIVDGHRSKDGFPDNLYIDEDLDQKVYQFYIDKFWSKILGDKLPSQDIANEMFDTAVNMNHTRAVQFLQRTLNVLNRDGALYEELDDDGIMGNQTLQTLVIYLTKDSEVLLLKIMNVLQGNHYIKQMEKHSKMEYAARGWFSRVKL